MIVLYKGIDKKRDLSTASLEALLAVIAEQQTTIGQLEKRFTALETRLNSRSGPGMPGNKFFPGRRAPPRKCSRKRRDHGFSRVRMSPTQLVGRSLELCPYCVTHLSGGWVHRRREVVDLPVVGVKVTEHMVLAGLDREQPVKRRPIGVSGP